MVVANRLRRGWIDRVGPERSSVMSETLWCRSRPVLTVDALSPQHHWWERGSCSRSFHSGDSRSPSSSATRPT
jgi:hypothetical protein